VRLNDRAIRAELRKQAISVPIPDDMWANISRELDKDAAKAAAKKTVAPKRANPTVKVPVRQVLALGAAAAVFWMVLIPSGANVDRLKQPATPKAAYTTPEARWDIPNRTRAVREANPEPHVAEERWYPTHVAPTSK